MRLSSLMRHAALIVTVAASVLVAAPPAEARAVQHCGMRITHNFTLHRNLHNCPGDGLVVAANNITIKLAGHVVDGRYRRSTAGIRITGFHGVTVQGGVIRQFGKGVWLVRANDNRILNNTITGSSDEGVFTNETSSRPLIKGNRISWSGTRIHARDADGIDARGNGVRAIANSIRHSNDDGIDVNGTGILIDGNTVSSSLHDGIDIDGRDVLVQNNVLTGNGDDGIRTSHTTARVTLINNITNANADLGIQAVSGTVIDGGGNRAAGNVDPRQCLRISCAP
jgi:parallel beta-helix repeat protein